MAEVRSVPSTEVMCRYGILSPASAVRSEAASAKLDLLDNGANEVSFPDTLYAYWLKTQYFVKQGAGRSDRKAVAGGSSVGFSLFIGRFCRAGRTDVREGRGFF